MSSSDDEVEMVPNTVSNYEFVDENNEPVSLCELPLKWNGVEILEGKKKQVSLRGTTDNGLQKVYKPVKAWKIELSSHDPELLVLSSKKNDWIKLLKPRKAYEDMIRSVLITVHCLNFARKNPATSKKALWEHLCKAFRSYEPRPSENDLVDHMNLISEVVKHDEALRNAQAVVTFINEKPVKRKTLDEVDVSARMSFIVDDDDMINENREDRLAEGGGSDEEDEEEADEDDQFEPVCAICDNGGDVLCCEGECLRSFHPTLEAGEDSACESLGFTKEEVEALPKFYCKNCQYKQHQCFACGELGSSDTSLGAEVFRCVNGSCGRFYHLRCVARLLHQESQTKADELQKKIAAGGRFACPIHQCTVCKHIENEKDRDLQFAICRRCPTSYHRKCLPRGIHFEDDEDEGIVQRAWDDLIPNRILIYCLKHEIDDDLQTPPRDHLKFPGDEKKKKRQASETIVKQKGVLKESYLASKDYMGKRTPTKQSKVIGKVPLAMKQGDSLKKREGRMAIPESSKKLKSNDCSKRTLTKVSSLKLNKPTSTEGKASLGQKLYDLMKGSEPEEEEQIQTAKTVSKGTEGLQTLDDDAKRSILAMVKDVASSIKPEDIMTRHKAPSTHGFNSKSGVDKNLTLGKVEHSVESLREALQKLEDGGTVDDAKVVCPPGLVNQIFKWKGKLRVYLAPFIYGPRYTSFGRHFTKVEKLKAIVDMLHWYVKDGDTIVDFCCGANDFSCLMNKKLDEMGKNCSYKNYDILQAKNDFNFERRDWMKVDKQELPPGGKLIMGLNPPFGVNARLANQFIDKALQFRPKLLILIVPPETERLDAKTKSRYDLIWENDELLAGKSFYLPGSVDVNDKQMDDWNVTTPPVYLWSRPDWTFRHKAIAQQHCHSSSSTEKLELKGNNGGSDVNRISESQDPGSSKLLKGNSLQDNKPEKSKERKVQQATSPKGIQDSSQKARKDNSIHGKNRSNEDSKKNNGKRKRGPEKVLAEEKSRGRKSSLLHRSPSTASGRSLDNNAPIFLEKSSNKEAGREYSREFEGTRRFSGSQPQISAGAGHRPPSEEPYSRRSHDASAGPFGHEYGFRSPNGQFMGHMTEYPDGGYRSYVGEDRYRSDSYMRTPVQLYGQLDLDPMNNPRSNYTISTTAGFPSSYGQLGHAADSSYNRTNMSTMQRYAPRLDELNHTRVNNMTPESNFSTRNIYDPQGPWPGVHANPSGFASGPYRPFSQQSSSGWLNE